MRFMKSTAAVLAIAVAGVLSGCATTITPDERLTSLTSGTLGIPADELKISNRQSGATNTSYIATTRSGRQYACNLNGGGLLALGLTNPPVCNPVARR
jgi:hypothetical protein